MPQLKTEQAITKKILSLVPPDQGGYKPHAKSMSALQLAWHIAVVLEALSGEELAMPVDFIGLRNDPAVCYLNIANRHSVHHRGQLSAYLRPMGANVPAIYVESADETFPPDPGGAALEGQMQPPAF
ncbi:MAG: hypothetical protein HYX25_05475 [Candidatus Solibacter usitatus]|nr:hypothetical protein [Candidatus Solibacter usitatus]